MSKIPKYEKSGYFAIESFLLYLSLKFETKMEVLVCVLCFAIVKIPKFLNCLHLVCDGCLIDTEICPECHKLDPIRLEEPVSLKELTKHIQKIQEQTETLKKILEIGKKNKYVRKYELKETEENFEFASLILNQFQSAMAIFHFFENDSKFHQTLRTRMMLELPTNSVDEKQIACEVADFGRSFVFEGYLVLVDKYGRISSRLENEVNSSNCFGKCIIPNPIFSDCKINSIQRIPVLHPIGVFQDIFQGKDGVIYAINNFEIFILDEKYNVQRIIKIQNLSNHHRSLHIVSVGKSGFWVFSDLFLERMIHLFDFEGKEIVRLVIEGLFYLENEWMAITQEMQDCDIYRKEKFTIFFKIVDDQFIQLTREEITTGVELFGEKYGYNFFSYWFMKINRQNYFSYLLNTKVFGDQIFVKGYYGNPWEWCRIF